MINERATHVLDVLAVGILVTARPLARSLGVAEKTLRRDIAALVDHGLPITTRVGRGGGWRLAACPPVRSSRSRPVVARVRVPTSQLVRLTTSPDVQASVRGMAGPGFAIVDFAGADLDVVAQSIAGLSFAVDIESPATARDRVAAIGAELLARYGSAPAPLPIHENAVSGRRGGGPNRSPEPASIRREMRTVRDRIGELPAPRSAVDPSIPH